MKTVMDRYLNNDKTEVETLEKTYDVDQVLDDLESHPYLLRVECLHDLEEDIISQENLIKKFGKGLMVDLKDSIDDLLKGSESVNKKYIDRLEELSKRAKDIEGKEKHSISSLASMIYNNVEGDFQTDLSKLLKNDISFLEDTLKLIKEIDNANDENIKTFSKVLKAKDKKEYLKIVAKDVNPNLILAENVVKNTKVSETLLYNTVIDTTGDYIKLESSGGSYSLKDKHNTNLKPYMTGKDISDVLKQVIRIGEVTKDLISLMKDLEEKHHPRTGRVAKEIISIEKQMIDKIGMVDFVAGLSLLIVINQKFYKTLDKFPRKLVARNIKVLKKFTSFGEKAASVKIRD